jgi:hypothetical protein
MMDYESFFRAAQENQIEMHFDSNGEVRPTRLSNEALFHLPLIAITILLFARGKRKPRVDQIGQLVGECFERTFSGFKGSSQHLGWSANLRMRTVRALTFLETALLIVVDQEMQRITIADEGRKVIERALIDQNSELAYTLKVLERSYRDINVEKQVAMDL